MDTGAGKLPISRAPETKVLFAPLPRSPPSLLHQDPSDPSSKLSSSESRNEPLSSGGHVRANADWDMSTPSQTGAGNSSLAADAGGVVPQSGLRTSIESAYSNGDDAQDEHSAFPSTAQLAPDPTKLEYGFVPCSLMAQLADKENWRRRANAVEKLKTLVQTIPANTVPAVTDIKKLILYLTTVIWDINFKVSLTALDIITELVKYCPAAGNATSQTMIECVAKKLGDIKIVLRQAHMSFLTNLMEAMGAGAVIRPILQLGLQSRSWRVREEAINVAIAGMLRFPRQEINFELIAAELAPTLLDCNQRVRQASMESMAVIANALGYGNMQPLVACVMDVETRSLSAGLLNAVLARISRRQLPFLGSEGLVEHSLPVTANGSRGKLMGPDTDWILLASSNNSSRPPTSDTLRSGAVTPATPSLGPGSRLDGNGAGPGVNSSKNSTLRPRLSSAGLKQLPWEFPAYSTSDPPLSSQGAKRGTAHSAPSLLPHRDPIDSLIRSSKPQTHTRISWAPGSENSASPFSTHRRPPSTAAASLDELIEEQIAKKRSSSRLAANDDADDFSPVRTRPSQLQLLEAQALRREQENDLRALGGLNGLDPIFMPSQPEIPKLDWTIGGKVKSAEHKPPADRTLPSGLPPTGLPGQSNRRRKPKGKPVKANRVFELSASTTEGNSGQAKPAGKVAHSATEANSGQTKPAGKVAHSATEANSSQKKAGKAVQPTSSTTGQAPMVFELHSSTVGTKPRLDKLTESWMRDFSNPMAEAKPREENPADKLKFLKYPNSKAEKKSQQEKSTDRASSHAKAGLSFDIPNEFSGPDWSFRTSPTSSSMSTDATVAHPSMSSVSSGYGTASSRTSANLTVPSSGAQVSPPLMEPSANSNRAASNIDGSSEAPAVRPITRYGLSPSLKATLARKQKQLEAMRREAELHGETADVSGTSSTTTDGNPDDAFGPTPTPLWQEDESTYSLSSLCRETPDLSGDSRASSTFQLESYSAFGTPRPPTSKETFRMPNESAIRRDLQATSATTPTAFRTPTKRRTDELSLSMPSPRVLQAAQSKPEARTDSPDEEDLQPLEHPSSAIATAIKWMELKENWELNCDGLTMVRRLCVHHADVLGPQLHTVLLSVVHGAESLRSSVSRLAIRTVEDMFVYLGKMMDPELDCTARVLLQRCGDSSTFLRSEAENALTSMVTSASPIKSTGVVCNIAKGHRNTAVRDVASMLLETIVARFGPDSVLRPRDLTETFLTTVTQFSSDASPMARYHAKRCLSLLLEYHDIKTVTGGLKMAEKKKLEEAIRVVQAKGVGQPPMARSRRNSGSLSRTPSLGSANSSPSPSTNRSISSMFPMPAAFNRSDSIDSGVSTTTNTSTASTKKKTSPSRVRKELLTNGETTSGPLPATVISDMTSTDYRVRDGAITDLSALASSKPNLVVVHAVKIFDAFIPRLNDANSKVAFHAITCLEDLLMMDSLAGTWSRVAKNLLPGVFTALASRHANIGTAAERIVHLSNIKLDGLAVLPAAATAAQFGTKVIKAQAIEAAADAFDRCYMDNPKVASHSLKPVIWYCATLLTGKVQRTSSTFAPVSVTLRHAVGKMVHIAYARLGDTLFMNAKQNLGTEEIAALRKLLEIDPRTLVSSRDQGPAV